MYVVLEGRVLISKFIPGAGEEALAFLERGDYFGEMALIDRAPRSAAGARPRRRRGRAGDPGRGRRAGILDMRKVSSLPLLQILCALVAKRLREIDDKIVGWYILSGGESPSYALERAGQRARSFRVTPVSGKPARRLGRESNQRRLAALGDRRRVGLAGSRAARAIAKPAW